MIKGPHIALAVAGFLFFFSSCKKENLCDCFKSRGETVLETRQVGNFNTIRAFDKIDVYYTHDTNLTAPLVQVRTGKHLAGNIVTKVSGGELRIENNNKCNFVRGAHNDVIVYITAPYVKYFVQEGVGSIFGTNTVIQDSVYTNILNSGDIHLDLQVLALKSHTHGIGDLYLKGTANAFFNNVVGQGFVNANEFVAGYVFMYDKSNGETHLRVTGQLDCVIASTGNIYYTGDPLVVNKSGTGSGKLIKQ